jgi:uncharacterized protein with ATP-grasp and redox domains
MGLTICRQPFLKWSYGGDAYDPSVTRISKKEIEEYCKDHPYPDNAIYSYEEMFYDITESEGVLIFPDDIPEAAIDWLIELIEDNAYD